MGKSISDKSLKFDTYITRRKLNPSKEDEKIKEKNKKKDSIRKVALILQKCETSRTPEELRLLESHPELARVVTKRQARAQLYKERIVEKEDPVEVIERKSERLAQIISRAKHLVCYTGAGISTSARIPDYRGSQGIWTLLQQGKEIGQHDLSLADPTYTHMALYELHKRKMLRFVVSQNCDGLHLRAGLPKSSLSEVHGNMYIEVCKNCKPNVEYWRLFDTTELTARFCHKTNRRCHMCDKPLTDTIVHFGERGNLRWPLNWAGACSHSEKADVILCLGSSLKVLKKYSWLWQMDKPLKKRGKICIINLQWTPKDKLSTVKINGKCDDIMELVMKYLNIKVPPYERSRDPIFSHASLLCTEELHTVSQPMLKIKKEDEEPSDENETACTSSDNDSSGIADSESYRSNYKDEMKLVPPVLGRKSKSILPSPLKTTPFLKTSLNSKHLILAEEESSSDDDRSINCDEFNRKCIQEQNLDIKVDENDDGMKAEEGESGLDLIESSTNVGSFLPNEANKENKIQLLSQAGNLPKIVNGALEAANTLKEISSTNIVENSKEQIENGCESNLPAKSEIHHTENDKINTQPINISQTKTNITNQSNENDSLECEQKDKLAQLLDSKLIVSVNETDLNSISCKQMSDEKITQNLHCDNFKGTLNISEQPFGQKLLRKTSITSNTGALIDCDKAVAFHNSFCQLQTNAGIVNYNQFYEIAPLQLAKLANADAYYKNFFEYCRAVDQKLPFWYDVGYAYSGLHSIIQPPPPEIDLWSSNIVPIFKMNKSEAECEFCFENYAEFKCQFYRNYNTEFSVKKYRNGRRIVCECCDFTDDELGNESDEKKDNINAVADESTLNGSEKNVSEKRAKLDVHILKEQPHSVKIQAGWYGKGYRKNFRKRKR